MAEIKVSAWERNDLIRILDYAKEKKIEDYENGKMTQAECLMDLDKINTILHRLTGIPYRQDYRVQRTAESEEIKEDI
jgi:hypothetical protein